MDWAELISHINWASVAENTISGTGILILSWLGIHFRRAISRAMLYLWARARAAAIAVGQWLRLVTHCRAIARENAELKVSLAAKDEEIISLRQALERSQQIHALAQQRLGIHIAQVLQTVSQRKNSWPLSAGQTIPAWPIEYEAHVIHEARDRGLLSLDPILRRLSVTPEGITFLIDSGHIPTPE